MKNVIALRQQAITRLLNVLVTLSPIGNYAQAALTNLADEPTAAGAYVPPNVVLDLSVEFPTAVVAAYNDNESTFKFIDAGGATRTQACPGRDNGYGVCYFREVTYIGYFDSFKCYDYDKTILSSTTDNTRGAFVPSSATDSFHECNGNRWSGNYLNWATTQAVDDFRSIMTGGNRSVDTTNITILEKARHTGQGGHSRFPVKRVGGGTIDSGGVTITPVRPNTVTPYFRGASSSPYLYLRVSQGDIPIPEPSGFPAGSGGFVMQVSSHPWFMNNLSAPEFTDTYYVRVKVCDSGARPGFGAKTGLETNCVKYGSVYKPEGLIQDHSQAMRFGVFGYLLDSQRERFGGVMRSRLKDTGPNRYVPGSRMVNNPKAEWSAANGTFVTDPEPADSSSSGVRNSGVVNYLNKFGRANGYKFYDPTGELFYESLKYLRNLRPSPEATKNMTQSMKDDFPVITNWDDPIQFSCQKNFIITIGDTNTNCDTLLPGSSRTDTCNEHLGVPSVPDRAIDVTKLTNEVGRLEGLGSLGEVEAPISDPPLYIRPPDYPTDRKASYYMAGLAYWANTNDIRPDDSTKPQTKGKQTAQSFVIDVLETTSPYGRNQYWLSAKYGGFDDINNDGKPANQSTFDKDNDGVPDNYFGADRPDDLSRSLRKVFDTITGLVAAGAAGGLGSPNFDPSSTIGNSIYQTFFRTGEWTGDVEGGTITVTASPTFSATRTKTWSAQTLLDTLAAGNGWDRNRKIATMSGAVGVPFRLNRLSATDQSALGTSATERQNMLNYLRGDKTREGSSFRIRSHILGDIVDSKAVPVGAPDATYQDYANAGYSDFKTSNASRKKMVYVGANDGMLHAFNGETDLAKDANGGKEVWAYIPGFVISGPSGTPSADGLAALGSLATPFLHHFYVNETPEVRDIDFSKTDGSTITAPNWRTILVGALGKGGKGFYALDVTDGINAPSENAVAAKVLWEFTDPDMGFSYGRPVIVKTAKFGWVVLVTSGYNNVSGPGAGQGFLYIVNARTGKLIKKIGTNTGDAGTPSGLGRGTAYLQNFDDFTADQFYVGDLRGNLWRFDLRALNGVYPPPDQIAILTDPTGNPQPITVAPKIEVARGKRFVFVGTGKDLAFADGADGQQQTMYGIRDGAKSDPAIKTTLRRSDLTAVTDITKGIPLPDNGWLFNLTGGSAATGRERVTADIDANAGIVMFNGNVSSSDPCVVGGVGKTYAVEFETGRSVLLDGKGGRLSYFEGSAVVGASLVSINRKISAIIFDSNGKPVQPPNGLAQPASLDPAVMNWREVLE